MIARSIKAKLLVFAIFFVGIATGILLANFYTTRVSGSPDAANNSPQRAQRDIMFANLEAFFAGRPVLTPVPE